MGKKLSSNTPFQGEWGKNLNDCFFTFYCQKHSIHKIDLAIYKKNDSLYSIF